MLFYLGLAALVNAKPGSPEAESTRLWIIGNWSGWPAEMRVAANHKSASAQEPVPAKRKNSSKNAHG
jgi:hypothetical protein